MFGRLYVGELKKQTSPGAIITLTVIAVVLAILMAVLFSAFNDLINTMTYGTADVDGFDEDFNVDIDVVLPGQEQTTNGESSQGTVYSPETVEFMLSSLREALAEAEAEKAEIGYDYYMQQDRIYAIRGQIVFYEFIRDNELYDRPIGVLTDGTVTLGNSITAETFINIVRGMLFLLPLIYASIVAGSTFADEFKSGTIKFVLTRPVARNSLVTAKLLASVTHAVIGYLVTFALCTAIGYAAFPAESIDAVFMFNNSSPTLAPSSCALGIYFATDLVMLLSYTVIAFFVGAVTKNRIVGIITPILLIEVVGAVISMAGVGRFFIANALDWGQFVGIGSTVPGGGNFFISLPVWAVYMAAMLISVYFVVRKRDAA